MSLENINTDVHELEKGMEAVKKEVEIRGKGVQSLVLRDFLSNSEEKLRKLKHDTKVAQEAFKECVEYFAESPRTTDANTFFCMLVRFTKAFKVQFVVILLFNRIVFLYSVILQTADQENEQRRRLELAAQNANNKTEEDVAKKNKINQKRQQVS